MLGRKPFYLIALLLVLAGAIRLEPVVATLFRGSAYPLGLHDLRNSANLLPSDPRYLTAEYGTTVYGPYFTEFFAARASRTAEQMSARAKAIPTIVARPGETMTLPDGERMKILAISILPGQWTNKLDSGFPVEEAYCAPNGHWMSREAARVLNESLQKIGLGRGIFDPPRILWNGGQKEGIPFGLEVIVAMDNAPGRLGLTGLCDTRTGWGYQLNGGQKAQLPAELAPDGLASVIAISTPWSGVRPNPLALKIQVPQGEVQKFKLGPTLPSSFAFEGKTYTLRNIAQMKNGNPEIYKGEPTSHRLHRTIDPPRVEFVTAFDSLPPRYATVRAWKTNGEEIAPSLFGGENVAMASENCVWLGDVADFDHLEISIKPNWAKAVLELPPLPAVPEANRATDNLSKMVLPPVTVTNEKEWQRLLGDVLQVEYRPSIPPTTPLAFPLKLDGRKVGDLWDIENSRYPPNELALSGRHFLSRETPGTMRRRLAPIRAFVIQAAPRALLSVSLLLSLVKGIMLLRASTLLRALRNRGYSDLTIWDAEFLRSKLGRLAFGIPSRDELGTIPGVDLDDLRSVVAFMKAQRFARAVEE